MLNLGNVDNFQSLVFITKHRAPNYITTSFDCLLVDQNNKPLNDIIKMNVEIGVGYIELIVERVKFKEGTNQQELEEVDGVTKEGKTYTERYLISNLNFEAFKIVGVKDAKTTG